MMQALHIDRWIGRVPLMVRVAAACLCLCGLILLMVAERANVLRTGVEVRLATEPVDPRDLFRGDYVVLSYQIGTVNLARLQPPVTGEIASGETVYVGLRPGTDGRAEPAQLHVADAIRKPGPIWLRGTAGYTSTCATTANGRGACQRGDRLLRVTYGLESYFVPQGEGRAIEATEASRVEIVAAVAANGRSAIKRLLIDGKPLYEEPPY